MRAIIACALIAAPLVTAVPALAGPTTVPIAVRTADRLAINDAITAIAAGADRHQWDRVRAAFADEVTTDYTALWGGEPQIQGADDLVAQWSGFLPGFEVTHHMVTNRTVTALDGDTAEAEADFTATHRIGEQFWTLGGRYAYELIRDGDAWTVSSMTMTPLWETGSRDLVGLAGERASAQATEGAGAVAESN